MVNKTPSGLKFSKDGLPEVEATLTFCDVKYSVPVQTVNANGQKKTYHKDLIRDIHGIVRPGEMLAVIGPSGCGKSTFLDYLADRIETGKVSGHVCINGGQRSKMFKRLSAYCQQEDALAPTLTVRETLRYAADFKLPEEMEEKKKSELVEKLIDDLGMRTAADTIIGNAFLRGVSGGQKRRVSIGVELVAQPNVVFLDVPTLGLDSAAAMSVMEMVKANAIENKRSVVCTIHQPSAALFALFDKIMILSEGSMCYFGTTEGALTMFEELGVPCPEESNPADFLIAQVNSDFEESMDVHTVISHYHKSAGFAALKDEIKKVNAQASAAGEMVEVVDEMRNVRDGKYAISWWAQFSLLLQRFFWNNLKNPAVYWARVIMYGMLSFVMGTLFFDVGESFENVQNRISVMFFVVAFKSFMSVAALPAFLEERAVYERERRAGSFQVSAFAVANSIAAIPFVFLISLVSAVLLYFLVGLHSGRFGYFLCMLFLALYAAESQMVAISAIVPQFMVGMAAASGSFGFFILTCGFFQLPGNIPAYWVWGHYMSFVKYAFQGMMYNDFEGLDMKDIPGMPEGTTIDGKDLILERFDMTDDTRSTDLVIVFSMAIIFRILFYLFLRVFKKGKR